MTEYKKNVSEPWFSFMEDGTKQVEGRLCLGDFAVMNEGDIITFTNDEMGFERMFTVTIKQIIKYDNFREYLECEMLEKCLPLVDNIEDGLQVYYKYYSRENELKYGVRAFRLG